MAEDVYLRPLEIEDAAVSFHWRNDPLLWKYTGKRPDRLVSEEIEREWVSRVMGDPSRVNYAICLKESNRYIGNIYLVDIQGAVGELGIFIGERDCHGKGYGGQALGLLKEIARKAGISTIRIGVDNQNVAALVTYLKQGAVFPKERWVELEMHL